MYQPKGHVTDNRIKQRTEPEFGPLAYVFNDSLVEDSLKDVDTLFPLFEKDVLDRIKNYQQEVILNEDGVVIDNVQQSQIKIYQLPPSFGKTTVLHSISGITIAAPTNELLDQIEKDMKVPYRRTPHLTLTDGNLKRKLDYYYSSRLFSDVKNLITKIALNDNHPDNYACIKYLHELANYYFDENKTLLTTHHQVFNKHYKFHRTIVFDEDPINEIVKTGSILLYKLKTIFYNIPEELVDIDLIIKYNNWIFELTKNPDMKKIPPLLLSEKEKSILLNCIARSNNSIPLFDILESDYIIHHKTDEGYALDYISKRDIIKKKNIIILSATPRYEVWKRLYPNGVDIYKIMNVRHKGLVVHDSKYSYSKQSLKREVVIQHLFDKIPLDTVIITYKDITIKNKFRDKGYEVADFHFFNTLGYNKYQGRNIAIIGIPYVPRTILRLYSNIFQLDAEDIGKRLNRNRHSYDKLEFYLDNAEFDDDLRKIQFEMLVSEIIQAAGRARHMHHDNTVYIYSGIPTRITDIFDNSNPVADLRKEMAKEWKEENGIPIEEADSYYKKDFEVQVQENYRLLLEQKNFEEEFMKCYNTDIDLHQDEYELSSVNQMRGASNMLACKPHFKYY